MNSKVTKVTWIGIDASRIFIRISDTFTKVAKPIRKLLICYPLK